MGKARAAVYEVPIFHLIITFVYLKKNNILFFTRFDLPNTTFHVMATKEQHENILELFKLLSFETRTYAWTHTHAKFAFREALDWPFDLKVIRKTKRKVIVQMTGTCDKLNMFEKYVDNSILYDKFELAKEKRVKEKV